MKDQRKESLMVIVAGAVISALALGLIGATPAQASGGWGFGMDMQPVTASCTGANLVNLIVDVPPSSYAGYVTGRLSNTRTQTSVRPLFGTDTVVGPGTPTLAVLIFNSPAGTVDGDVLHLTLTLSSSPSLTPVVGSLEFSYRCATGEVLPPPAVDYVNHGYGDMFVQIANAQDAKGNPELQMWCVDAQAHPRFVGMTVTQTDLAKLPSHPAANTLVDENNSCPVHVAFYVLTGGTYQVVIGPDPYGFINNVFFAGLPPGNVTFLRYNLNQLH